MGRQKGRMKTYKKQRSIVNEELLKTYRSMTCWCCKGKWNVAGHHIMKRSKLRLDVPYNLVPLCVKCHTMVHSSPSQFRRLYGEYTYKYLTDWHIIFEKYSKS